MIGTLVNVAAILAGGTLGLILRKGIPERIGDAVMKGLGLCVIYIGVSGALEGNNPLVAILAMVIGAGIGTLLDLDGKLNRLGERAEALLVKNGGNGRIAEGFVTASLLYCVGAMSVVGSLSSGLTGNHEMLFTKSLLDCISSIILGASFGAGVLLSAIPVLLYQGALTLLAQFVSPVLGATVIADMTCVGSLLIIAIGLNMLGITKLKVMDYILAIFLAIGFSLLMVQ